MNKSPHYLKVLSCALLLFCVGYFVSKGLMNVGFYALTLGGLVVLSIRNHQKTIINRNIQNELLIMATCLCGLMCVEAISWWLSPYAFQLKNEMVRKEIRLILIFVAPLAMAFIYQASSQKIRDWVPKIVICGVFFLGSLGALQWWFLLIGLDYEPFRKPHIPRASYGLQNMAIFYSYQIYPLIILLSSWLMERDGFFYSKKLNSNWRMLTLGAIVLGLIGILGSGNRAALIIILAMIPFIVLRQNAKLLLRFVLLAFLLGGFALFKTPAGQRLLQFKNDPGISHRTLIWKAHLKTFAKHPLIGVGRRINTKKMYYDSLGDEVFGLSKFTWYGAHNLYLDLLSGLGILGLLLFLGYWWLLPLKVFLREIKHGFPRGPRPALIYGLFLAYGSWFIGSLTEGTIDVAHSRVLLPALFTPFLVLSHDQ